MYFNSALKLNEFSGKTYFVIFGPIAIINDDNVFFCGLKAG